LGFFYCGDPELKVVAEQSCRITHTHPNGVAGGVVQAVAVAAATRCGLLGLGKEKAEFCRLLVDTAAEYGEGLVRPLERLAELKLGDDVETKAATLATLYACDVSAVGSVPAAAAAFLCAEDFEDAVVTAVNAGGDTDTIGAMSGALAGAFFGAQAIGEDLLVGLDESEKGRAQVEELARRLAEKARGRAVGHFELDEALEEEEGPNEEEQP
jgi:poly(ADP-ribose) glycohydrolase ARH3